MISYIISGTFFVIACVFAFLYFNLKNKIVTIEQNNPIDDRKQSRALKISDEIDPFIEKYDGKFSIKVVKK